MREIVLDTETTGLEPAEGHRIIEICGLELENHIATGRLYHTLVQPERDIPAAAAKVHGLTAETLAGAPIFATIAEDFLGFIGDSPLVIHNAEFDLKFLNAELARVGRKGLASARAIDTIVLAKRRFPGARYSLDELCRRFNIDLSERTKHSAKVDVELLAQVYLELLGGRQAKLTLAPGDTATDVAGGSALTAKPQARQRPNPLPSRLHAGEREAHARFIASELGADPLWKWGK